ncbi:MAG: peptide-N4-asparagine amidase, partial [Candidatus Sulfotelmatobacter sp.]
MPRFVCLARVLFPVLLIASALVPFASASGPYVIGSANTVTADPNVTVPTTTPCVVQLFSDAAFYEFNVENFTYTPPSACPGPWAKVVLVADINLNAGIQYDRTANFWLGPVNIYFGTTAEPSAIGPSWQIENDLTDYSSIFYTAQSGQADIGNTLCCGLTSTIYASASLYFYPLAKGETAPVTANQVFALSAGPSGGTVALNTTTSTLSGTFTLPTNVQTAYLDVYAQSQSNDEFWYTCVPNDVSAELYSCGDTGFRETEITIDGQPAGVAPVFPWIFTGGIDPYLWFPIPGVQTLNFTPYRVNLTPFAAQLSNGSQQHTVSLSVYNADSYFSATASLLLYLNPSTTQTTGAITKNTLTAPSPVVTENLNVQPTFTKGTVDVTSNRSFTISGYVNTPAGPVTTKVAQTVNFFNNQF